MGFFVGGGLVRWWGYYEATLRIVIFADSRCVFPIILARPSIGPLLSGNAAHIVVSAFGGVRCGIPWGEGLLRGWGYGNGTDYAQHCGIVIFVASICTFPAIPAKPSIRALLSCHVLKIDVSTLGGVRCGIPRGGRLVRGRGYGNGADYAQRCGIVVLFDQGAPERKRCKHRCFGASGAAVVGFCGVGDWCGGGCPRNGIDYAQRCGIVLVVVSRCFSQQSLSGLRSERS